MKKLHIKTAILLLITLSVVSSCTKNFDEINENPNAPTAVTPGLLLPGVQRDMVNTVMGEAWGIGNIVVQHTAKNQFVNEDRYLWGEVNGIWNTGYSKLRDINAILETAEANNQQNYKGVALVMKSWIFSLITDAYGDCPYSEAGKGQDGGVYYPAYDSQEQVYNGILADLKTANDILGTSSEAVSGDLIYSGNLDKWKKLANSLRVRALMRISNKRDVAADLRDLLNDPAKYPLFTSNAESALYTYLDKTPDQFPLYSARVGSFNEFRASKTLVDVLKTTQDPRISVFFRATPASIGTDTAIIRGIPNGLDDVTAQTYAGGQQNHSQIGTLFYEAAISAEGLKIAKGVIMTYAELQFLLAEAAERGLISTPAEAYYLNGIQASYAFYNLTPATDFFNRTEVAYTGSQSEKLAKIATQKWVSLYFQGMEAWFDWRRTRLPALTPAVSNQNDNKIPVRFIYPIIEQALNGPNRDAAVARQGEDDINTLMWYLK